MDSWFPISFLIAALAFGLAITLLWRTTPRWQWLAENSWAVWHWSLLLLVAGLVWCATALSFTAGIPDEGLSRAVVFSLVLCSVGLLLFIRARTAQAHRRKVTAAALFAVAIFLVQCVPYPNVGLPFGYWGYPNRTITAFRQCPKVQSARLTGWNTDATLEEFQIEVAYLDQRGRPVTSSLSFAQYPDRKYIRARVDALGCGA